MAEHKSFKTILKADSPYLGEWDLPVGSDLVLTIKDASTGVITGDKGRTDTGLVLYFEENYKPLFCNMTNAKMVEKIYKTDFMDEWVGKKIQLYVDNNINFGGKICKGIRIRNYVPKTVEAEYHCAICGTIISKDTFEKSTAKYGKAYCSKECLDTDTKGKDLL